ncbi:hypothetical protein CVT24_013010 [Panaeolus cyanescens]|uniref:GST N-terminal domain-containing protein n=1 Tax=Panaeolus cyanescens TaxID=181874 RepID=A0A409VVM3_9AGAR|nr:hypothetical protein CVT24_013010 [Panaeolus cyanescens]
MKIIIIGAGIGGLSTYLSLKKHLAGLPSGPVTIKLVESHKSPAQQARFVGGGLGLGPNGLRAISSFSPAAVRFIQRHGFPVTEMSFCNAEGKLLTKVRLDSQEKHGFKTLMLPRALVLQALLQDVDFGAIHWATTVLRVRECGSQVAVDYVDGTTETADLVIGADGVRSVVKKSMFGGRYEPSYSGLVSTGGFIDLERLPRSFQDKLTTDGIVITFGHKGFLGYSMASPPFNPASSNAEVSPPLMQWWTIYESPEAPTRKETATVLESQLQSRYGSWKTLSDNPDCEADSTFSSIIRLGCQPGHESSPPSLAQPPPYSMFPNIVTTSDPFIIPLFHAPRLPRWSNSKSCGTRGRIVLIGDAAHNTSQFAGQPYAIEDAVVYAMFLRHYLSQEILTGSSSAFSKAAKAYEDTRKPHVHRISHHVKQTGGMMETSRFGGMVRDFAIKRLLPRIPQSATDRLFGYDPEAEYPPDVPAFGQRLIAMIILYDIPSTLPHIAWSFNTWKTRFTLNYKSLPYRTEWVEYPDIESHCKSLSILPTEKQDDGSDYYTLPAIWDTTTGAKISDSYSILQYLETTYPDRPTLFPDNTKGLHLAFQSGIKHTGIGALWPFILPAVCKILNPPSQQYFHRTRSEWYGKPLETIVPEGEERTKEWAKFKASLDILSEWYGHTDEAGPFLMGQKLGWGDVVVASLIMWMKVPWENSDEWREISSSNGGRWAKLLDSMEPYAGVK